MLLAALLENPQRCYFNTTNRNTTTWQFFVSFILYKLIKLLRAELLLEVVGVA